VYWYILRWKENGVVAAMIEVKVLDQVREESQLDVAEVDKKRHWALRLLHMISNCLKSRVMSARRSMYVFRLWIQKSTYLAECKELTKGGHFPEIAVFEIE
jgi:hypothetical protein